MTTNIFTYSGLKFAFLPRNVEPNGICLVDGQDISKYSYLELAMIFKQVLKDYKYWKSLISVSDLPAGNLGDFPQAMLLELLSQVCEALDFYELGYQEVPNFDVIKSFKEFEKKILDEQDRRQLNETLHKKRLDIPISALGTRIRSSEGYVYVLQSIEDRTKFKIGCSKNPMARSRIMQIGRDIKVEPVHIAFVDKMRRTEKLLHRQYRAKWIHGEWFRLNRFELVQVIQTLKNLTISR
jgi:hypothetical protein